MSTSLIIAIAFPVFIILSIITMHAGLVRLRNTTRESWSNIDVALKRRHDLIPNLIETVKGYMVHETELLTSLTRARAEAQRLTDTPEFRAKDEQVLSAALMDFFVRVEAYPDLKASAPFLALQRELVDTEDRIAASRRFYNSNAKLLNSKIEQFPHSIIATSTQIERVSYFELENLAERNLVNVSFT